MYREINQSNLTLSASLLCALDVLGDLVDLSSTGGLLSSRLALVGGLTGLDLLEGGITLGGTDLGLLGGALAHVVEGKTDDSTGDLVGAAAGLLDGDVGGALLVQTAPGLGPYELGGLLPLHGKAVGLGGAEEDGLAITTDEELAVPGVDPVLGESTEFSYRNSREGKKKESMLSTHASNATSLMGRVPVLGLEREKSRYDMSHFHEIARTTPTIAGKPPI